MVWYNNPMTYLILVGAVLLAWGAWAGLRRSVPFVNRLTKMHWLAIGVGGFFFFGGSLGMLFPGGTGSIGGSAVDIYDLQVTTDFKRNATDTLSVDAQNKYMIPVRLTDAQSSETATHEEVDTGIITVFRNGKSLPAASCIVEASTLRNYQSELTPGDGTTYTITEVTTQNELEVYLEAKKSGSGAAATTASPKERTVLEFDEGVSQAHLGVAIEVDEAGLDQLSQYSTRDVVVDICGAPFVFRVQAMTANT